MKALKADFRDLAARTELKKEIIRTLQELGLVGPGPRIRGPVGLVKPPPTELTASTKRKEEENHEKEGDEK